MRTPVLAIMLLAIGPAFAEAPLECNPNGTQAEMNLCAREHLDAADGELNETYRAILARKTDDPGSIAKIKIAQRLWVQLRDADLHAQFPLADGENPRVQYGSIYPLEHAEAAAAITRERTRYLRQQWPADGTGR